VVQKFATRRWHLDMVSLPRIRCSMHTATGLPSPMHWFRLCSRLSSARKLDLQIRDGSLLFQKCHGTKDGHSVSYFPRAQNQRDSSRTGVTGWDRCMPVNDSEDVSHTFLHGKTHFFENPRSAKALIQDRVEGIRSMLGERSFSSCKALCHYSHS
jgi:hypothetical protein